MRTGKVIAVTERGGGAFKVGDVWLRMAFDAKRNGLTIPDKGSVIEYQLNDKGYVNWLAVQPGEAEPSAPAQRTVATVLHEQRIEQANAAAPVPSMGVKHTALMAAATYYAGVAPEGEATLGHICAEIMQMAQEFETGYLVGGKKTTTRAPATPAPSAPVATFDPGAELPF